MEKFLHFIVFFILAMASVSHCNGQFYSFENLTAKDGLGQSSVTGICQDQFGNLWFSTQGGGLSRYDGSNIQNFTKDDGLLSDVVYDVAVDLAGNIWASTADGISRFDGDNFKNYKSSVFPNDDNSASRTIFISNRNEIWTASFGGGVQRFRDGKFENFNQSKGFTNSRITDIVEDRNSNLLFSTIDGMLYEYDYSKFQSLEFNLAERIYALYRDDHDVVWIGTENGIVKYANGKFEDYFELFKQFDSKHVMDISQSSNDDLWLGSVTGAFRFDLQNVEKYDYENGFSNAQVEKVFQDREGNVWFGSEGNGAFRLINKRYKILDRTHGLSGSIVFSIKKDKNNNYWFGYFANGIDKMKDGKVEHFLFDNKPGSNRVAEILLDGKRRWYGTRGAGLYLHSKNSIKNYTTEDGLAGNFILHLFKDSKGTIWVCTEGGLSKFNGRSFENYTSTEGLRNDHVVSIYELEEDKFLVGSSSGINYLINDAISQFEPGGEKLEGEVLSIVEDLGGNIFFGTHSDGIYKYITKSDFLVKIDSDGLRESNLVYDMVFDDSGNLLVGSERGIDKLDFDKEGNVSSVVNYPVGEVNTHSILKDNNGLIWFGTVNGIAQYDSKPMAEANKIPPTLYFSEISDFYQKHNLSLYSDGTSNWFGIPKNLELPFSHNNLSFGIKAVHIGQNDKIQYSYMLEGFEDEWSPSDEVNRAGYTNLPPGDYALKGKASIDGNTWTKPISFSFLVLPPFYRTWWFYLICALFFSALIVAFNKYRTQRAVELYDVKLLAAKKIQKQMAMSFHDDLGNNLASMMVLVSVLKLSATKEKAETLTKIDQIENLTKLLFHNTKDFIWSIDPDNNTLISIYFNLKDYLENKLEGSDVGFYSNTNLNGQSHVMLRPGSNRQIVLLIKEVVNELINSGGVKRIDFMLNVDKQGFKFELKTEKANSSDNQNDFPQRIIKRMEKTHFITNYTPSSRGTSSFSLWNEFFGSYKETPNKRDVSSHVDN